MFPFFCSLEEQGCLGLALPRLQLPSPNSDFPSLKKLELPDTTPRGACLGFCCGGSGPHQKWEVWQGLPAYLIQKLWCPGFLGLHRLSEIVSSGRRKLFVFQTSVVVQVKLGPSVCQGGRSPQSPRALASVAWGKGINHGAVCFGVGNWSNRFQGQRVDMKEKFEGA